MNSSVTTLLIIGVIMFALIGRENVKSTEKPTSENAKSVSGGTVHTPI